MLRDRDFLRDGYDVGRSDERTRRIARDFEAQGFLKIGEGHRVECVRTGDRDYERLASRSCTGWTVVGVEEDDVCFCDRCGREMWPELKTRLPFLPVTLNREAITAFLIEELRRVGLEAHEGPQGLLKAPTKVGELHVCFVDYCVDAAPFDPGYLRRESTVFVTANPSLAGRVPAGASVFFLLDLLVVGADEFRRVVRERAHLGRPALPLPAVWARPAVGRAAEAVAGTPAMGTAPGTTTAVTAAGVAATAAPPVVARMFTESGVRTLTRDEYLAVAASATEVGLFIDVVATDDTGRHPVIRRDDGGATHRDGLSRNEALVLAELVERRAPLQAGELRVVRGAGLRTADKFIEKARAKADVTCGRYRWRAFQTIAGDTPTMKRYVFNPPVGMRFAVVVP